MGLQYEHNRVEYATMKRLGRVLLLLLAAAGISGVFSAPGGPRSLANGWKRARARRAHDKKATVHFQASRMPEAVAEWRWALEIDPDNVALYNKIAIAYMVRNDYKSAVAACQEALAVNPGYAEAHFNLGLIRYEQGEMDQALAKMQEVLTLNTMYPEAHYIMGLIYENKGLDERAQEEYMKEINTNRGSRGAWAKIREAQS